MFDEPLLSKLTVAVVGIIDQQQKQAEFYHTGIDDFYMLTHCLTQIISLI